LAPAVFLPDGDDFDIEVVVAAEQQAKEDECLQAHDRSNYGLKKKEKRESKKTLPHEIETLRCRGRQYAALSSSRRAWTFALASATGFREYTGRCVFRVALLGDFSRPRY
jgi:hypothetical protein